MICVLLLFIGVSRISRLGLASALIRRYPPRMTDKPPLSVVQLHDGRPPLSDVVGRLRLLADQIERGELGEVTGALVLLPRPGDYPRAFGFGSVDGGADPLITLALASQWFALNRVGRL